MPIAKKANVVGLTLQNFAVKGVTILKGKIVIIEIESIGALLPIKML